MINKFRIIAIIAIIFSFTGIGLMTIDKNIGLVLMVCGLVPSVIFILKARQEEQ